MCNMLYVLLPNQQPIIECYCVASTTVKRTVADSIHGQQTSQHNTSAAWNRGTYDVDKVALEVIGQNWPFNVLN